MESEVRTEIRTEEIQTMNQTLEFRFFRSEIDPSVKRKRYSSAIFISVSQVSFIILMAVFANYDLKSYGVNGTSYSSNK